MGTISAMIALFNGPCGRLSPRDSGHLAWRDTRVWNWRLADIDQPPVTNIY
jgi:hypothetical protein